MIILIEQFTMPSSLAEKLDYRLKIEVYFISVLKFEF